MLLRLLIVAVALALSAAGRAEETATSAAAAAKSELSLEDIRRFTAVYHLVKQAYVEDVSDQTLMQAAIRGLLAGLDPHSQYLDQRELGALTEDTTGAYDGLGVEVITGDGTMRVIAPIDDTPAQRAGIRAGDVVTRIDGKTVTADNVDEAVDLLRGKSGTKITLTVMHEGASQPENITLTRETIKVASVRVRWLEPSYVYVRIAQFQEETGAELKRKLVKLRGKDPVPLHGVVLDLRSNPGGLLTAAVEVSDAFLDSGLVVTTRGRLREAGLSFSATPGDISGGAPVAVLVDKGTASAAEIVSGALKDNHRAVLLGQKTFGKGSVQTILPLDDGSAVKLTTARYFTPNGTSIQAAGIVPDILLRDFKLTPRDVVPSLITSERDLPNHLKGDNENASGGLSTDGSSVDDYALSEALHVLKAMALRAAPAKG